jgi:uncharacterized protein YbjQ (UPF0145 family)
MAMVISTMNDVETGERRGSSVLAMRFDTSDMSGNWTEVRASGTAGVIEPLG